MGDVGIKISQFIKHTVLCQFSLWSSLDRASPFHILSKRCTETVYALRVGVCAFCTVLCKFTYFASVALPLLYRLPCRVAIHNKCAQSVFTRLRSLALGCIGSGQRGALHYHVHN